jgi:hypothetical protein
VVGELHFEAAVRPLVPVPLLPFWDDAAPLRHPGWQATALGVVLVALCVSVVLPVRTRPRIAARIYLAVAILTAEDWLLLVQNPITSPILTRAEHHLAAAFLVAQSVLAIGVFLATRAPLGIPATGQPPRN